MAITKAQPRRDVSDDFIAKAPDGKPARWQRGSKTQITLSIAPELLERIDDAARRNYVSRAALVAMWLSDRLEQETA